MKRTISVQ